MRASLRDINALDDGSGFRDRLITIAVRDDPAADRELLRTEIEERLDQGKPIALLLDALDETYDDRAAVVIQLDAFLAGVPDTSFVLVATRDIAYGQAATLGFADLRSNRPATSANSYPRCCARQANTRASPLRTATGGSTSGPAGFTRRSRTTRASRSRH